jgi:hypothetical protein
MLVCRYAKYGDVSPKIYVYAFGVVVYELISAREAVVNTNEFFTESKGLADMVFLLAIPLLTLTSLFSSVPIALYEAYTSSFLMLLISFEKAP